MTEQQKRRSDAEQERKKDGKKEGKKPLVAPFISNDALLMEFCLVALTSSPECETRDHPEPRSSDCADDPGLSEYNKSQETGFVQNSDVLPECYLAPLMSSPERETRAPECADDPGLLIRLNKPLTKHAERESLGDLSEPLETRYVQNAAVLPECCIGPRISSPGRETLISVASDAPELRIHGRSVAEYQQLYHSVLDVLVKRKEHMTRSKKIKQRLWDELSGPRFWSSISDTQQQLTETCPVRKEFNGLNFYN